MQFLALDIGSSFLKGAVLDLDACRLGGVLREPFPEPLAGLSPGRFEVAPQAVVDAARQLVRRLLMQTTRCAGIVTSTQMGGVVLADERCEPLTNYLSWRDQRSVWRANDEPRSSFDRYRELLGEETATALGRDIKPGYMTSLLFWLTERGELPRGAWPLAIGDFVLARLCKSEPVAHPTAACGSVDVVRRQWRDEAWSRLGMGELRWPRMAEFFQPVGHWCEEGRSIPCYPALGDHACALAGVLLEEGELSLNISTGSQISQLTGDFRCGDYQTRPYLDSRFLNTITHIPAGRSLNVLVDLLTELARAQHVVLADPWPYLAQAVEAADDSELDVDLSFFAGPFGNQGRISGITTENLRVGPLFRAAFRSMAANYAALAQRISPARRWSRLVFSGGLAQNLEILRRMIRESLAGACRICAETEDTLRGLLVTALVVAGRAASVADASRMLAENANETI